MTDDRAHLLRLERVEEDLKELRATSVNRSWLDERLGRVEDAIAAFARESAAEHRANTRDIEELKDGERARRRATYTAVVGSISAILVALFTALLAVQPW